MLGRNATPLAAIAFQQLHLNGNDMAVIAARGSFVLKSGGLQPKDDQEIVLVDEYEGDPQTTPLVRVADLVPFKPATDITVLARSHPPADADPAKGWLAGVRLNESRYAIRVHGPRAWTRKGKTFVAGDAEIVAPVMIDYRNSWGDLLPGDLPGDPAPYNPLGVRRPHADAETSAMAQIEAPQEETSDPQEIRAHHGFGPIAPFWRDRQQFAGTYDEEWMKHRQPLLPADFDYRFYQCAHPRLIVGGFLRGDETIELFRLRPEQTVTFDLPALQPFATFIWNDGREVGMRLNLDGVHIDARGSEVVVDLTWRGWLPICPNFFRVDLDGRRLDDPELLDLPFAGIDGIEGINASGEVVA